MHFHLSWTVLGRFCHPRTQRQPKCTSPEDVPKFIILTTEYTEIKVIDQQRLAAIRSPGMFSKETLLSIIFTFLQMSLFLFRSQSHLRHQFHCSRRYPKSSSQSVQTSAIMRGRISVQHRFVLLKISLMVSLTIRSSLHLRQC